MNDNDKLLLISASFHFCFSELGGREGGQQRGSHEAMPTQCFEGGSEGEVTEVAGRNVF